MATAAASVASVLVLPVLVIFGSYFVRKAFQDGDTVCVVTRASLDDPRNVYDGQDHPLDPQVDDRYPQTSGCYAGELVCVQRVEVFSVRYEC